MKFYYVYVLQSIRVSTWIYVGITKDLRRRFTEHNKGDALSTSKYKPLILIHYEAYVKETDAKRREKYLKTTKGKTTLKTMLVDYFVSKRNKE